VREACGLEASRKGIEMTDLSSLDPEGGARRDDAGDPADHSPIEIDEDAIRERAAQDDDDTDSLI
jgi:hypothetical protein